ncbi:MAG: hypothetical protein ACLVJ3_11880 [Coprococcus phoceensis]|jgi:hypothetical protein
MQHIDLEKFANGAFSAQVNRAIEEVTKKYSGSKHGSFSNSKNYNYNWIQAESGA